MIKIKVLHMFTTLDAGGVESFLYNYYMQIKDNIQFDFIVPSENIGFLEKELSSNGCHIFHVPQKKMLPFSQMLEIYKIIKKNDYDIIHCHGYKSFIGIVLGYITGCKVRILHSHMVYVDEKKVDKLIRIMIMKLMNSLVTQKFACGIDAGRFLFGNKEFENGNVIVINNAVDLNKFKFDQKFRNNIRSELKLEEDIFLIGNIGRLTYQKNQEFLLKIAKIIKNKNENIKIALIGNGEDEKKLNEFIKQNSLQDVVFMLGRRKDIPQILSALDLFVLPSRYEGLPVVLAEVQAAGLPSIISNTITDEVNITNSIIYLPINENYDEWFSEIMYVKNHKKSRKMISDQMRETKFDLKKQSRNLLEIYTNLAKGKEHENR